MVHPVSSVCLDKITIHLFSYKFLYKCVKKIRSGRSIIKNNFSCWYVGFEFQDPALIVIKCLLYECAKNGNMFLHNYKYICLKKIPLHICILIEFIVLRVQFAELPLFSLPYLKSLTYNVIKADF